jgi:UDP-2-acetamido-2,6-beta-L-arabino-hexul-4-ose reductase
VCRIVKTVLITGANGFIGKNLRLHLAERKDVRVVCFTRDHAVDQLPELLLGVDFVFHLAGVNRPQDPQEFVTGNARLTQALCDSVAEVAATLGKKVPVVCPSSIQAALDNPYGQSKRTAEDALYALQLRHGVPVHVFRLPNVFGKWCKENYNSVVATFCYNIARGLPIQINDPSSPVALVYVDDVISHFLQLMDGADIPVDADGFATVAPRYTSTVGDLAQLIQSISDSRNTLITERVGTGLVRSLYATYVSYLPNDKFSYRLEQNVDPRGKFVEMLKTLDSGQFSYFTAHPGITRGGHYHHTKTEKFLVIKGRALFRFRHLLTSELVEVQTNGRMPQVVDTIPGWTHDITNVGDDELVVMLWANEKFDREKPDTVACKVLK